MTSSGRGWAGKTAEWFLRSAALRAAREERPDSRTRALLSRARVAFDLAEDAATRAHPQSDGTEASAALVVYRDAIYAAARGLSGSDSLGDRELDDVLSEHAHVGPSERVAALTAMRRVAAEPGGLPLRAHDADADLRVVQRVASGMVARLSHRCERERALRQQRITRPAMAVILCVGAWQGAAMARLYARPDLVPTAHWRASSATENLPREGVGVGWPNSNVNVFFHTAQEAQPWIVFDLARVTTVRSIEVSNRGDCCHERAVPLVVEGSVDGVHFAEMARRTTRFFRWREEFEPRGVRYVRFRALTTTMLHFASVSIR